MSRASSVEFESVFEVESRDLLARIGRLETKSGALETPSMLPVINPAVQPIPPAKIFEEFGFEAVMANAYLLYKSQHSQRVRERGIHAFLGFPGVVMTDSGAYQILVYGEIPVEQREIIRYQEEISTDIGVILDIPTSWKASPQEIEYSVNETMRRAKEAVEIRTREDVLWVAPIQGGTRLDLVSQCAKFMDSLPYHIVALGSPTTVMENYMFDILVDMIMAAKLSVSPAKPFHLFGAGHPMMFSLAVALGCDLFDSAAYAIYSREGRYISPWGTQWLSELTYFPCSCPICTQMEPKDLLELPWKERYEKLAEHNLFVCREELNRIKQAIVEGRLWEHLEIRARSHPSMAQALKKVIKYVKHLEKGTPIAKPKGLLFVSRESIYRPEVYRHLKRLFSRYRRPSARDVLLLIPEPSRRPYSRSKWVKNILKGIEERRLNRVHVVVYAPPFDLVPIELCETYPLSQHECSQGLKVAWRNRVLRSMLKYASNQRYSAVFVVPNSPILDKKRAEILCQWIEKKGIQAEVVDVEPDREHEKLIEYLSSRLREAIGR